MNTLWTFGDSYTENFRYDIWWCKDYLNWKGYIPKVYGEIISEKLNLKLKNYGQGGTNNYQIFQTICNNINNIKKNDIVIISWSELDRFRIVNKENNWELIYNNKSHILEKLKKCEHISNTTIEEILINRYTNKKKYLEEIKSWEIIIKKSLAKNNLIFWSPFDDDEYGEMMQMFETIKKETNNKINDKHFSETGQLHLSYILLERLGITQNRTKI
jgi:hypothetical protein